MWSVSKKNKIGNINANVFPVPVGDFIYTNLSSVFSYNRNGKTIF